MSATKPAASPTATPVGIPLPAPEPTPSQIVAELDRYIVGQDKAKRAVAIALRNRYRRQQLSHELRDEVRPKNILMIGPTGVGKTEIARRLAAMANAPFLKVEATKFTEVGYVGRDVDAIIRDLVEFSIRLIKTRKIEQVADKARENAVERILDVLLPNSRGGERHPLSGFSPSDNEGEVTMNREEGDGTPTTRDKFRKKLLAGELDERLVEIDVTEQVTPMVEVISQSGVEEMGFNLQGLQNMMGNMFPAKKQRRKLKVREAREALYHEEVGRLMDQEEIQREAVRLAEQSGIVFLDEIDKIAASYTSKSGPDVSREGVQRDLLPLVEGSTVVTKHGMVKTDHILFIAAGAFNVSKPSDLIPELQGRFPIRVELEKLSAADFRRILTEPQNALLKQYAELLRIDNCQLEFTPEAIDRLADLAHEVNVVQENIGARRLHTILEKLLEEVSFAAPDLKSGRVTIDRAFVDAHLTDLVKNHDLAKFIL